MSGVVIDVTPTKVRKMASNLRRLAKAFDALDDDTEARAPIDVSGDTRVGTQLREFGENWREHRERMAEEMEVVATLAVRAADAYVHNERTFAKGFEGGARRR